MNLVECNHIEVAVVSFIILVIEDDMDFIQLQLNLLDLGEDEIEGQLTHVFLPLS